MLQRWIFPRYGGCEAWSSITLGKPAQSWQHGPEPDRTPARAAVWAWGLEPSCRLLWTACRIGRHDPRSRAPQVGGLRIGTAKLICQRVVRRRCQPLAWHRLEKGREGIAWTLSSCSGAIVT